MWFSVTGKVFIFFTGYLNMPAVGKDWMYTVWVLAERRLKDMFRQDFFNLSENTVLKINLIW